MDRKNYQPFDFISPIDSRYYGTDPEFFRAIHPYLSEEATIRYQLKVEQALIAELETSGVAPAGISQAVAQAVADVTPAEVYEEEKRLHHNIRALAHCIRKRLPDHYRGYVHLFATSNDIMDTARAVAFRDVTREVLLDDLCELVKTLIYLARRHAKTPQIGRTHGRHAEPVTVGYWLANYVSRLGQRTIGIADSAAELRGKFSGAVGAHNALALRWPSEPGTMEALVLGRLGLKPCDGGISTQTVQPEYLTDFAHSLMSAWSVFANLADDVRNLMRSEIEEIEERPETYAGRVGSSTMPHKVNPKNFENVKSLWKAYVPRMISVYMDQISEHQRDLTNSGSSRFLPEMVVAFDYSTRRLREAIRGADINEEALSRNLSVAGEWTVAEPLYIALALDGHPEPYEASRALVDRARREGIGLLTLLRTDPDAKRVLEKLSPEHQEIVLDPTRYVGDAASRTLEVCDEWEMRLNRAVLKRDLVRPREEDALIVSSYAAR